VIRLLRLLNLRRLRRQPLRAALGTVAVAAGVSLAVSVVVTTASVSRSFADFGHLVAGPAPLRIVGATSRGGLDERMLATVQRTPGVAAAVPMVQAVTLADPGPGAPGGCAPGPDSRAGCTATVTGRTGSSVQPVLAVGIDCRAQALVPSLPCGAGSALATDGTTGPPVVSSALLRRLGPDGVLLTDNGRVPLRGAPVATRLDALGGGQVVVLPLSAAQAMFDRPGRLDVVYVMPTPGTDVTALRSRLAAAVGSWNGVLGSTDPPPAATVVVSALVPLFGLMGLFALAIAAVLVYDTMALSLEERRLDLAILAAVGGGWRVMSGVLAEAGVLGLAGGVLGTLGGVALAGPVTASLSDFTRRAVGVAVTVHLTPAPFVVGALLGTALAVVAAWFSARRALRMDVAAELSSRTLRQETAPRVRWRRAALFLALGLAGIGASWLAGFHGAPYQWQARLAPLALVAACTFITLALGAAAPGVVLWVLRLWRGRNASVGLGLANLVRNPGRTGVMAVAVASAVAISFVVASFDLSIRDAITSSITQARNQRLRVSTLPPNNAVDIDAGIPPAVLASLQRLPGVAGVETQAFVGSGHASSDLVGVEGGGIDNLPFEVVAGTRDRSAFERGQTLVGAGLARRLHLGPGSMVALDTPTGRVRVPVQGVWLNGDFAGQVVTMPLSMLTTLYGPQPAGEVALRPRSGVTLDQLAREVRAAGLDPDLEVQTPAQLAGSVSDDVRSQLAPFWTLQRGLLVVAFVAVLSTLLLVGVQRRRELGLLAAVGMRPSELFAMVMSEAAVVAVVGIGLGILGAVGQYEASREVIPVFIGFKDPFRLAGGSVVVYGPLVALVVLVAAALPAWRTSRLEVVGSLRYE
jgi:putative ABC transport system permease protein